MTDEGLCLSLKLTLAQLKTGLGLALEVRALVTFFLTQAFGKGDVIDCYLDLDNGTGIFKERCVVETLLSHTARCGKAFDFPKHLYTETFFPAVVLKVFPFHSVWWCGNEISSKQNAEMIPSHSSTPLRVGYAPIATSKLIPFEGGLVEFLSVFQKKNLISPLIPFSSVLCR